MAAPSAFAGPDQIVEPNVFHGLVTKGYDNSTAHWLPRASRGDGVFTQASGPVVTLTKVVTSDGIVYTFTTPKPATTQTLVFRLTITAENGTETATDDITITVPPWET